MTKSMESGNWGDEVFFWGGERGGRKDREGKLTAR